MRASTEHQIDWWLWRIVVDERIPDGLRDVQRWSFVDTLEAHVVLDALDEAAEAMRPRED